MSEDNNDSVFIQDLDQFAHARVLKWAQKNITNGVAKYVMREAHPNSADTGQCLVLSMNKGNPVPGGYSWEKRPKRIAAGENWVEVERQLVAAGLMNKYRR